MFQYWTGLGIKKLHIRKIDWTIYTLRNFKNLRSNPSNRITFFRKSNHMFLKKKQRKNQHKKKRIIGNIGVPFLVLSGEVGESAWIGAAAVGAAVDDVGPEDNVEGETGKVQEAATGLAAALGSKSFLLWLQSLVISRVLPWSGLQGRVAICKRRRKYGTHYSQILFLSLFLSLSLRFFSLSFYLYLYLSLSTLPITLSCLRM